MTDLRALKRDHDVLVRALRESTWRRASETGTVPDEVELPVVDAVAAGEVGSRSLPAMVHRHPRGLLALACYSEHGRPVWLCALATHDRLRRAGQETR
jgi:hypothetical protein